MEITREEIVPDIEIILGKKLILQLAARIQWATKEIEEDYISGL